MSALIGAIVSMVGGIVKSRQKISEAKTEAKIARVTNGIPGYSDEWLIFIWSAPFVMVFIPGLDVYAQAGFAKLATLPEWYIGGFMTLTAAVFGIDKLFAWKQ